MLFLQNAGAKVQNISEFSMLISNLFLNFVGNLTFL